MTFVSFTVWLCLDGSSDFAMLPARILGEQSSNVSMTDAATVVAPNVQAGGEPSCDSTRAMTSVPPDMGPDEGYTSTTTDLCRYWKELPAAV